MVEQIEEMQARIDSLEAELDAIIMTCEAIMEGVPPRVRDVRRVAISMADSAYTTRFGTNCVTIKR